jgi:ADP-ribosylation factor-like protein 8/Arf/Sar family protein
LIEALDLRSLKNRVVGCYSISAKKIINIDVTLKWLDNLKRRK